MNKREPLDWANLLGKVGVTPARIEHWAEPFSDFFIGDLFSSGDKELPDFLSEILHESGRLSSLEENLNYSAVRLTQVWPTRFPTLGDAQPYANNPQKLAARVYNGRLGNTLAGDGWAYRGSGLIQMTGYSNFRAVEKATGIPLTSNPDLARQTGVTPLKIAHSWWESHVPDSVMGNVQKVRASVNGGAIGLDDVTVIYNQLMRIL